MKEPLKYTIHHYWFEGDKYRQASDGGYDTFDKALLGVKDYLKRGHYVDYISDSRFNDRWIVENGRAVKWSL